jgi:hypothetical protein
MVAPAASLSRAAFGALSLAASRLGDSFVVR